MIPLLLVPRSAGELLDTAIIVGRRHYFTLVRLAALPYGVGLGFALIGGAPEVPAFVSLLIFLVTVVLAGLAEGCTIVTCSDLVHGRVLGTTNPWTRVRQFAIPTVLGYSLKWMLAILGFFLLIAPGAYILCLYFGIPAVTLLEGVGLRQARRRSRDLARAHLGRIFATIGLFDLAVLVASFGAIFLLSDPNTAGTPPLATVISWVVGLMLLPIRSALVTLVYYDCRIRSEGYDLEQAAVAGAV